MSRVTAADHANQHYLEKPVYRRPGMDDAEYEQAIRAALHAQARAAAAGAASWDAGFSARSGTRFLDDQAYPWPSHSWTEGVSRRR